ncbi:MAG: hypothetical protein ACHQ15_09105, partial [Candidatus Limnocylindrales bacterium]
MRHIRLLTLAGTLGALLMWAAPVSAFPLEGCTLTLSAFDAGGTPLGTVAGGMQDGTVDHPLVIDGTGRLLWAGTAVGPVVNPRWQVALFGMPTLIGGQAPSAAQGVLAGSVGASALPFPVVGEFHVSMVLVGDAGTACRGGGWVRLTGDPLGTVPFIAAAGVAIIAFLLLLSAAGGGLLEGLVGGFLMGLAVAVLAAVFAVMPFDVLTPWVSVGAWTAAGLLLGIARMGHGRSRVSAASTSTAPSTTTAPGVSIGPSPALAAPDGAAVAPGTGRPKRMPGLPRTAVAVMAAAGDDPDR